jgi:hypothetical protein
MNSCHGRGGLGRSGSRDHQRAAHRYVTFTTSALGMHDRSAEEVLTKQFGTSMEGSTRLRKTVRQFG